MADQEYNQYLASKPESVFRFQTIEIYNSIGGMRRYVTSAIDRQLTLESTAPRNPGETVTFEASNMNISEPGLSIDTDYGLIVNFGNVGTDVIDYLVPIAASDGLETIDIIYRVWLNTDTTGPKVIRNMLASSVSVEPKATGFVAEYADFTRRIAGGLYTTQKYPGLAI